jgi:hypothetical protein
MKIPAYFLLGLITIGLLAVIACGGAEPAPVSTVATDVVDTPAVPDIPDSAGADSVVKTSGPGPTSARSATPYSSIEPDCKKRPYTR